MQNRGDFRDGLFSSKLLDNLGIEEGNNDNFERAVKHFIIAANQGHDGQSNR